MCIAYILRLNGDSLWFLEGGSSDVFYLKLLTGSGDSSVLDLYLKLLQGDSSVLDLNFEPVQGDSSSLISMILYSEDSSILSACFLVFSCTLKELMRFDSFLHF